MKAARHFAALCLPIIVALALSNFGIGLSLLGFAWTTTGCAATPVAVANPEPLTFQDLLDLERRAFFRRQELESRQTAHLMGQSVGGSSSGHTIRVDDPSAPEGYTLDGQPGKAAWQFHMGYAAQRMIAEHYAATHPRNIVLRNFTNIRTIVDEAGGNLGTLNPYEEDLRPDMTDVKARFVFEIQPPGAKQLAEGKSKIDRHLRAINMAMRGVPLFKPGVGYRGELGVRFADGIPAVKLEWETTAPGIVQYRWRRLDTEDEDDCREAYEEAQWKDLTAEEMARYALRLHQAVEHLVRTREALGQTRAAAKMPVVLPGTSADFAQSLALWSTDDESPWLLPVMRKPPPQPAPVRRDARLLAQTTGGGSSGSGSSPKMHPGATTPDGIVVPPHPSAPEAYTLDGLPGKMPWQFFLGYSAHRAIAYRYWALHNRLDETVFRNHISVATIVQEAGGDKALLDWSDADLRPDITHTRSRWPEQFVFEIKPEGPINLAKGKEKLAQYIGALNVGVSRTAKVFVPGPNDSGELWIMFKRGELVWRLTWKTTAPALLQYKWSKPDTKEEKDRHIREEAWRQAIEEGRWRDISRQEMEDNAKELFETVEGMVLRRDVLGLFRDGVTVAIEGVGAAAEIILSARLWNHIDTAPRLVPIVRVAPPVKPPPMKAPTVSAKPPPPVNAPPLGSDKRMTPKTMTRSPGPGKTPTNISPN